MKTITKEINLLEIEDIEQVLSKYFGTAVKIGEVECRLARCIPIDTGEPQGAYLEFRTAGKFCDSYDVLYNDDLDGHYLKGKRLSLDEPWASEGEIFAFDVSVFKSFVAWIDSSD